MTKEEIIQHIDKHEKGGISAVLADLEKLDEVIVEPKKSTQSKKEVVPVTKQSKKKEVVPVTKQSKKEKVAKQINTKVAEIKTRKTAVVKKTKTKKKTKKVSSNGIKAIRGMIFPWTLERTVQNTKKFVLTEQSGETSYLFCWAKGMSGLYDEIDSMEIQAFIDKHAKEKITNK